MFESLKSVISLKCAFLVCNTYCISLCLEFPTVIFVLYTGNALYTPFRWEFLILPWICCFLLLRQKLIWWNGLQLFSLSFTYEGDLLRRFYFMGFLWYTEWISIKEHVLVIYENRFYRVHSWNSENITYCILPFTSQGHDPLKRRGVGGAEPSLVWESTLTQPRIYW